ncbi:MAG TPA: DinB family protein [Longimicrobiaceae bacterium]|nr:DinB family protein [Longimicrobiaceae bacterium]
MLVSELRELVRHMEWADALVWRAVLAHPAAHADAPTRERLHHVHMVQWVYLQIWRGEPVAVPEASALPDLRAIRAWGRDFHAEASRFLDSLEDPALRRRIEFPWAPQLAERFGSAETATLAETLLQVTSHSAYHRGQINARLREIGGEPPLADFVAWIWMRRPGPPWDEPHAGPAGPPPAERPSAG